MYIRVYICVERCVRDVACPRRLGSRHRRRRRCGCGPIPRDRDSSRRASRSRRSLVPVNAVVVAVARDERESEVKEIFRVNSSRVGPLAPAPSRETDRSLHLVTRDAAMRCAIASRFEGSKQFRRRRRFSPVYFNHLKFADILFKGDVILNQE